MPVLLVLAWLNYKDIFLIVLICAFISDGLDGFIARRLNQTSELGAKLDSIGDVAIYFTLAVSAYKLWPHIIYAERLYVSLIIASIALPMLVGALKFGGLTSYHTWLVKIAVTCVALSTLLMLITEHTLAFRMASVLSVIAALEEIAITIYLKKPISNVKSLWHVSHYNVNEHQMK